VPEDWCDLTAAAWAEVPGRPLRFYLHVPYCTHRCDYCDFTTYTPDDPRGQGRELWLPGVLAELDLAARVIPPGLTGPVSSVFIGGGTPTLLPPTVLGSAISAIAERWGMAAACEITVEANPETVTPGVAAGLVAAGVTRVSVGMQSARPHVLAALGRQHRPASVAAAVEQLRAAGIEHLSCDLIYGARGAAGHLGESVADWRLSVEAALDLGVGHVSAYALTVEPGTALATRVARGRVSAPDEDDLAVKYDIVDEELTSAGMQWYEISNWAVPGEECQHNLGYWQSDTWWGIGPGAHSHLAGVRWWNHRHPSRWRAQHGRSQGTGAEARWPVAGWEVLTAGERALERAMCEIRLRRPWPVPRQDLRASLVAEGLLTPVGATHALLTRRGRLLADHVLHRVLGHRAAGGLPEEASPGLDEAAGGLVEEAALGLDEAPGGLPEGAVGALR